MNIRSNISTCRMSTLTCWFRLTKWTRMMLLKYWKEKWKSIRKSIWNSKSGWISKKWRRKLKNKSRKKSSNRKMKSYSRNNSPKRSIPWKTRRKKLTPKKNSSPIWSRSSSKSSAISLLRSRQKKMRLRSLKPLEDPKKLRPELTPI